MALCDILLVPVCEGRPVRQVQWPRIVWRLGGAVVITAPPRVRFLIG